MDKTVCIISHQHLCRNPRVLKESLSLEKLGYKIIILTATYSKSLLKEDFKLLENRNIQYISYSKLYVKNYTTYITRAINKLGRYFNFIGIENKFALGYAPNKCLTMALKTNADLFICHQELPSYIGTILLKKGKKVAFDLEDWYSEDLLANARKFRPLKLLAKVEHIALTAGNLVYTTSLSMAGSLAKNFRVKTPEVIYNSFNSFSSSQNFKSDDTIRLIWLSQTIGYGRGLEEVVQVLNKIDIKNFEINLRGNVTKEYKDYLTRQLVNKKHRINFLPLILNDEIQQELSNYDAGLALELNRPVSRNLTLTNKIFHYLSVGLPVIASATEGQLSLQDDFKPCIFYYKSIDELKDVISTIDKKDLMSKRKKVQAVYQEKYDWSIMEKKLQNIVQKILS